MNARPRLAILGYHKIGDPPAGSWETWYLVPERTFENHLAYLDRQRWQVIDLVTLHAALDDPSMLPERAALITFDDGFRSFRGAAMNVLREFGYPAVMFMPADHVGSVNRYDADTAEPEEPLCDAGDLRALAQAGIEIGSHGASHRAFSALDPAELEDEVVRSKRVLESIVSRPVSSIAYPYGDAGRDPRLLRRALMAAGYRSGFLYGGGPVQFPVADPYLLPRLAMGADTDLRHAVQEAA